MRAWDLFRLLDAEVSPERTKIHLATFNGKEDPLDLYRIGRFRRWQQWQGKKNFEREFVVALIQMPETHRWLFAGAYAARGRVPDGDGHEYRLDFLEPYEELDGRLIVRFERPGRQSYLLAETWIEEVRVSEIRPERLSVPEFPGFKGLHISKALLDVIVRENVGTWRSALSSVAGVYLIADPLSGKFYVGSAFGKGGLWQRWCHYAATGHGGNRELKALLKVCGDKSGASLQFSVLEIADTHASESEVCQRESHWKGVLLTRHHGLNAN